MKNNYEKIISIGIIALVVLLPFYIADAYAANIHVTRSSGEKLDGYFDGQGDNWIVSADANLDGREVKPEMVTADFGGGRVFDECTAIAGGYECTWESGITTASSRTYSMDIFLKDESGDVVAKDTANLIIDADDPEILEFKKPVQEGRKIKVQYSVRDAGSGLKRIEFFDGGVSLGEITNFTDNSVSGQILLDGQGNGFNPNQTIRIEAEDKIGHISELESEEFLLDLKSPVIKENSFLIGSNQNYVPGAGKGVDISVEVEEENDIKEVVGDFSGLGLSSQEKAVCFSVSQDKYKCVWSNKEIGAQGNINVDITATDEFGNTAVKTITRSFNIDNTAPAIEFFGTESHYNNKDYIKRGAINKIILVLNEAESGIDKNNIKADFRAVGNAGQYSELNPDNCTQDFNNPEKWTCIWNISISRAGPVFLSKIKDNVGNAISADELTRNRIQLSMDLEKPTIDSVKVVSLGNSYQEKRDYFQTGDFIDIIVNATDNVAVKGYADLTGITKTGNAREPMNCTQVNDYWECSLNDYKQVKNGPVSNANYRIFIEDVGGNIAEQTGTIQILKSDSVDANPDYWRVGDISNVPKALDRQTTKLAGQRMFFEIPLKTSEDATSILSVELAGCVGDTEFLNDSYVYGSQQGAKSVYAVLEFNPFDSTGIEVLHYNCTLNLFTKYGKSATFYPETEEINLNVSFYKMRLGEASSALENKISNLKKDVKSGYKGTIGKLNKFLGYVRVVCGFVKIAVLINRVANIANDGLQGLRASAFGTPAAIAGCTILEKGVNLKVWGPIKVLEVICALGSCDPKPSLGWYANYQNAVLNVYNAGTFKLQFGLKSTTTLYDNLPLSVAGVCIPGVIYNLDKKRQIDCRYISCLEKEVAAGTSTVESCRELKDYQECKYVYGELFQLIPFVPVINEITNLLKSMLSDPVGLIRGAAVSACVLICPFDNKEVTFCDWISWGVLLIDLANDIVSSTSQAKTINKDYCSQVL